MKNAANCDKYCELQIFVNHRIFERTLHPLAFQRVCLFERHFSLWAVGISLPTVRVLSETPPCPAAGPPEIDAGQSPPSPQRPLEPVVNVLGIAISFQQQQQPGALSGLGLRTPA